MVLGVGRVGRAVLDHAISRDVFDSVCGVVRTKASSDELRLDWDTDFDRILDKAKECTHLLVTLPPGVQLEQCTAIAEILPTPVWVGVLSTTGVYGHHDGAWVVEESECKGRRDYIDHEIAWLERTENDVNIFRCAGIYGPQASALHTVFQNGIEEKQNSLTEFPTSRIHLDDIVSAIDTSMFANIASDCYNLADDVPANRSTVLAYAAELLESIQVKLPSKKQVSSQGLRTKRRKADHKRVCNKRLKAQLLPHLKYPSYREGLVAILEDDGCPWWR